MNSQKTSKFFLKFSIFFFFFLENLGRAGLLTAAHNQERNFPNKTFLLLLGLLETFIRPLNR